MSSKRAERARRPWSLAARLAVWYALSCFALLLLVTGLLYLALVRSLTLADDALLHEETSELRVIVRREFQDLEKLRDEVARETKAHRKGGAYFRVLDPRGHVVGMSRGMEDFLPAPLFPAPSPARRREAGDRLTGLDGRRFLAIATTADTDPAFVLHVAVDLGPNQELLGQYRRRLWLALAAGLPIAALVGYLLARRGLRGVGLISATARRIGSTSLAERIRVEGLPAELATLGATFNGMLDRIGESFERLERFSADLAHELRTPIHNLLGETEVALAKPRTAEEYREVLESSLEEYGRLSRVIESLLFLAHAEHSETAFERQRVTAEREALAVCEYFAPVAEERGVALTADGSASLTVSPVLFRRLLSNLLANALDHTPRGGRVRVEVAQEADGGATIRVADTGRGIAAEHLPRVFDRFFRGDPSRTAGGSGLGLAIAKSIVELHRGTIAVDSALGQGTLVTLRFPAA